jgi:putative drug exporter of the RND superfamily
MSRALYRLARTSYRHRRLVLVAWLATILAIVTLGLLSGGAAVDNFSVPGTQSQQALTQLEQALPTLAAPSTQVVFASAGPAKVTGSAEKAAIETSITRLRSGPQVASVSDPFASGLVSKNGHVALATVSFRAAADSDVTTAALSGLTSATATARTAGLQVDYGGDVYPGGTSSTSELPELIGVLVALVVLLVMFGALVAAGIPLIAALSGVGIVTAGTTALAAVTQISSAAVTVALMLALACGIDYALFIVHRHRTQLKDGMALEESVSRAVGTAGSSVVFAALTVVVALCGLALTGIPFLAVMGFTGAGAVLLALLISVTLLPAMLGFAGRKVLASRRPGRARRRFRPVATVPAGQRWAEFVVRRRTPLAIGVIALLALLAVPALRLSYGLPVSADPPTASSQAATSLINENLGAGVNGPLLVVADVSARNAASTVTQIDSALAHEPDVLGAATLSAKAPLAVVEVIPSSGPNAAATAALVSGIRGLAPGIQQRTGSTILVGDSAASAIDTSDQISADLPMLLAVTIGLALVLLTFALRAPLVPLESVLGYLLSVFAALGAEVAVFQWGWAKQLLGVTPGVTQLPARHRADDHLRALERLRGLPRVAHQGRLRPVPRLARIGPQRPRRQLPGGHRHGPHHGARVRRLHRHQRPDGEGHRLHPGRRGVPRRLPRPARPRAGAARHRRDGDVAQPPLAATLRARPRHRGRAPAGHHRAARRGVRRRQPPSHRPAAAGSGSQRNRGDHRGERGGHRRAEPAPVRSTLAEDHRAALSCSAARSASG